MSEHAVVRPGQKTPYRRATRAQVQERINAAGLLLELGIRKAEIHRLLRARFGVQWRQADRDLDVARARMPARGIVRAQDS